MRLSFLLLIIAIAFIAPLKSQPTQSNLLDSKEIPFKMVKNAVVIPVTINGITYQFVLDTGGLFTLSKKIQEKGKFPITDSVAVSDANNNEQIYHKVQVPEIAVGELKFVDRTALIIDDGATYPNSCYETDGMIGRDFFEDMVLHFDYEKGIIRLTNDASVLDLDEKHKTDLQLSNRGLPNILLTLNDQEEYIEFDCGSGDFFSYKSKTAKQLKTKSKADKLVFEGIFSFGVGGKKINPSKRYKVKVESLEMAGTIFPDFYSDFSKPSAPRIGAGILYHGKVTVDYKNLGFYFEPYPKQAKPTVLETFGFDIVYLNGEYLIKWVLKDSFAAKQGLRFGLELKAIDGVPIAEVAKGCEGYINGYAYKTKDRIVVDYFDKQGALKSLMVEKIKLQ